MLRWAAARRRRSRRSRPWRRPALRRAPSRRYPARRGTGACCANGCTRSAPGGERGDQPDRDARRHAPGHASRGRRGASSTWPTRRSGSRTSRASTSRAPAGRLRGRRPPLRRFRARLACRARGGVDRRRAPPMPFAHARRQAAVDRQRVTERRSSTRCGRRCAISRSQALRRRRAGAAAALPADDARRGAAGAASALRDALERLGAHPRDRKFQRRALAHLHRADAQAGTGGRRTRHAVRHLPLSAAARHRAHRADAASKPPELGRAAAASSSDSTAFASGGGSACAPTLAPIDQHGARRWLRRFDLCRAAHFARRLRRRLARCAAAGAAPARRARRARRCG